MKPNRAVNTDAHRLGFARAVVAGYLARWGSMAFTVRCFLSAPVSGGANAGRASVKSGGLITAPLAAVEGGASVNYANAGRAPSSHLDCAASPLALADCRACANGAVRKLLPMFRRRVARGNGRGGVPVWGPPS